MKIGALIVDDEPEIRWLVRHLIESFSSDDLFVVGEAASGAEAIERAVADNPLVIVLDNMMPEMSGVEAAQRIRVVRPDQIIILCSAYLDEDVIGRGRGAGVQHFISKDQMRELPALIREVANAVGGTR